MDHADALLIALIRAYDSYITPLAHPFIRCWKTKRTNDGHLLSGWFILGMSKQKIPFNMNDPIESQHIAFHVSMKYWDLVNVLTLEQAPPGSPDDKELIERLLNL